MIGTWLLALFGAFNAQAIPINFSVFQEFRDSARALVFAGTLSMQQVPEPAGLALIGLGVLGLALVCRKRRVK
jgi:hypothetical protein